MRRRSGLAALAQTAHAAFVLVKYVGALYLLYLAYKLWTAPAKPFAEPDAAYPAQPPHALFLGSLTLTLSNPKPMLFFLALLPTVVPLEHPERLRTPGDRGSDRADFARDARGLRAARGSGADVAAKPEGDQLVNRGCGTLMAAAAVAVATR